MWAISYEQLLHVRDRARTLFLEDYDRKTTRDITGWNGGWSELGQIVHQLERYVYHAIFIISFFYIWLTTVAIVSVTA